MLVNSIIAHSIMILEASLALKPATPIDPRSIVLFAIQRNVYLGLPSASNLDRAATYAIRAESKAV